MAAVKSAVLVPELHSAHAGITNLSGRCELSNNDFGGICSRVVAARFPTQKKQVGNSSINFLVVDGLRFASPIKLRLSVFASRCEPRNRPAAHVVATANFRKCLFGGDLCGIAEAFKPCCRNCVRRDFRGRLRLRDNGLV